ncbi:PEF-CTERM sorting domain-containing protein [Methanolobus sp. ZRKC3]|uniref:PEF-CTERM sorting domain-containing protein n=1 Tax=Methanolobus sp. ZRKC3 TaxID=3125786 RepID=UPI00324583EE
MKIKQNMVICIGISLIFLTMFAGNTAASTGGDIDIEKYVWNPTLNSGAGDWDNADIAPGPSLFVGSTVQWKYEVTNNAGVPLLVSSVADNQPGVTPEYQSGNDNGDILLDPTETWIYTATGTAVLGLNMNIATVDAMTGPFSPIYHDEDSCHYTGIEGNEIPEFPTIVLPIAAILGLALLFQRRKE